MKQIKDYLYKENTKLKTLSTKAKAEYIWEYYKIWIILIISIIVVGSYLGYRINHTLSEYDFYITFVGTQASVGNGSKFHEGFLAYSDLCRTESLVEFNSESYWDYTQNAARGNEYYEMTVAYIDAGVLDGITMTPEAIELFGQTGRLLDLNSEECRSIKEKYGDKFIYCTPLDEEYSQELVPVGIDISDSILMTKYNIYKDKCAFGIGEYTDHIDKIEQFLDYIYSE